MTHESFTYWLQGYVELGGGRPTEEQWKMIKEHLTLCFNKVTPSLTPNYDKLFGEPKETICAPLKYYQTYFENESGKFPYQGAGIGDTAKAYIYPDMLNPNIKTSGDTLTSC